MCYVFDDFSVAACWFTVVGGRGQRAAALESGTLQTHALHFALFRFGKLGCYDDQTEVDHEEGADLKGKETAPNVMPETKAAREGKFCWRPT